MCGNNQTCQAQSPSQEHSASFNMIQLHTGRAKNHKSYRESECDHVQSEDLPNSSSLLLSGQAMAWELLRNLGHSGWLPFANKNTTVIFGECIPQPDHQPPRRPWSKPLMAVAGYARFLLNISTSMEGAPLTKQARAYCKVLSQHHVSVTWVIPTYFHMFSYHCPS